MPDYPIKPKKKGVIGLQHYSIPCTIGVNPDEWEKEQTIYVDIKVRTDFSSCVQSDHLKDTINYLCLAEICTELAQTRHYKLLETFASEVLDHLMVEFSIDWAWIRVKKPSALQSAEYTFVELEQTKLQEE